MPFCAFKFTTGHPCPACGTTRSVLLLFEGNFSEAILMNPLGLLGFLGLIALPIWLAFDFFQKKQTLWEAWNAFEKILKIPIVYVPLIVLVLLNWIWNIYKGL